MQNTELGKSQRQLLVGSFPGVEDQTMTGTIHRLQREGVFIDLQLEHVLGVILPVT